MFSLIFMLLSFPYGTLSNLYIPESKTVNSTEAFFIPVDHKWFPEFSHGEDIEYSASLLDMPDLPNWMFCHHPANRSEAFFYGSANENGIVQIEIIALNKNTYSTARKILKLKVEPRSSLARYEVEMKFLNLNVDDMFHSNRLQSLVEIFQTSLWKESGEIYITKVVSSTDAGGRLPLNPKEKEGVVVRIGGTYAFSRDLKDLEREVKPLRNRIPCPRDYKRTSVEHLFRSRNFVADWCSFRLVPSEREGNFESSHGWSDHPYSSISLTSEGFSPQSISLPRRDLIFDFIVSIIIPSVIVGVVSTALTCFMCCGKDRVDKKCDATGFPLDQYNSMHHIPSQIPRLGIKTDSLPYSNSTPESSFRSCAESPSLTQPKGYALRSSSRTGTLRSLMPPPPYTQSGRV